MYSTLGQKNSVASSNWRFLSNEEQKQCNDKAAAINRKEEFVDIEKEVKKLHDALRDVIRHCSS